MPSFSRTALVPCSHEVAQGAVSACMQAAADVSVAMHQRMHTGSCLWRRKFAHLLVVQVNGDLTRVCVEVERPPAQCDDLLPSRRVQLLQQRPALHARMYGCLILLIWIKRTVQAPWLAWSASCTQEVTHRQHAARWPRQRNCDCIRSNGTTNLTFRRQSIVQGLSCCGQSAPRRR